MKLRSFRLRIALLSAALAGVALVGFGAISWAQIYNAKLNQLDADLLNQLVRSGRLRDPEHLQRHQELLANLFGQKTSPAMLVLDSEGKQLYESNLSDPQLNQLLRQSILFTSPAPRRGELPSVAERLVPPRPRFVTKHIPSGVWRIAAVTLPDNRVAIAVNLDAIDQDMTSIRNVFLISIPGMLLLVASGAWIVAGRALRPVRQLTEAIQQVTVNGLDQRIPVGTTDIEFVQLIQVFNQMLERLE